MRASYVHDRPAPAPTRPVAQARPRVARPAAANLGVSQWLRDAAGEGDRAVQRKCAACEHREDDERRPVQRLAAAAYGEIVEASRAPRGPGVAMPAAVQAKMEGAFGADFSAVRVHPGSARAVDLAAHAFTEGNDVHVAPGRWAPHSAQGQELLGHELAHVVQQRAGRVAATRQMSGTAINDDPALEHEADVQGARAARGQRVAAPQGHGAAAGVVQRLASDFEIRGKDPRAGLFPNFILFKERSTTIDAAEGAKLAALAAPPGDLLELHGYASEEGSDAASVAMASSRLAAVKTKLVAAGHDPLKITVSQEASKGKGVIDYRHMRAVEVVRAGAASSVPAAPATLPCAGADETAFVDGEAEAEAMISKATSELGAGVLGAAMNGLLVRFFGDAAAAPAVKANLEKIKAQLVVLKPAARHGCANASVADCAGSSAFNVGDGATAKMTLCQGFLHTADKKKRGGILLHEAAHGTPGLLTEDNSYSHVRQIEFLSQPDALNNSDSYVLLVRLFDTPGSMTVGVPDVLAGLSPPEQTAAKRSVAWLETWLVATYQDLASLYTTIHESIPAGAWSNPYYKDVMSLVAPLFGVTAPPALPTLADKIKVAAIHDRVHTMRTTMHSTAVTIAKGPADVWAAGPGPSVKISAAFLADTPPHQLRRLLQAIVIATPGISAGLVPKYVELADQLRNHRGVGSP